MFQAEGTTHGKALRGREVFSALFREPKKKGCGEAWRREDGNGQCPPEHQIKPEHLAGGRASTQEDLQWLSPLEMPCIHASATLAALKSLTGWQGRHTGQSEGAEGGLCYGCPSAGKGSRVRQGLKDG